MTMNQEVSSSEAAFPEVGFYYPNQFWYHGVNSVKLRNNVSAKVGLIRSSLREQ
jgi:hypothetical protein